MVRDSHDDEQTDVYHPTREWTTMELFRAQLTRWSMVPL